jgi:hypothetical protein
MSNFLDIDRTEDEASKRREKELEFAMLYVDAFVNNPAGRQLLAHWEETILKHRTPCNAHQNEYVWAESRRQLIQSIRDQIAMAGMIRGV